MQFRSKFAFISILNGVIINISFNYTKHDHQHEVKIFQFLKCTSLKDRMCFTSVSCVFNLTAFFDDCDMLLFFKLI